MKNRIIDGHVHIFSPQVCSNRSSYFHDPHVSLLFENPRLKMVTAEELVAYMDESGSEGSLCLGFSWYGEKDCFRENEYILQSAEMFRGRIIPFASVPLELEKPYTYVRECSERGFAGIGEIAFYSQGFGPREENFLTDICRACSDEKMSLVLHVNEPVGHVYSGKYITDFTRLLRIISLFSELHLMLSHWGGGLFLYELMPEVKRTLTNVWYDTAVSPFLYNEKIYTAAMTCVNAEKIVFGTDYPLLKYDRYINEMNTIIKDQETIRKIVSENVRDFIGERSVNRFLSH